MATSSIPLAKQVRDPFMVVPLDAGQELDSSVWSWRRR